MSTQSLSSTWLDRTETLRVEAINYYRHNRRALPWRDDLHMTSRDIRFYQVLVSEFMLQQTQVSRVVPYYSRWMKTFGTLSSVANAELADVLRLWQGLGYNRRAKYLHDICRALASGSLPENLEELMKYKGIGKNTAGAISLYRQHSIYIHRDKCAHSYC